MIRNYQDSDVDVVVAIWRKATAVAHPFLSPEFVESEAEALRNTYLKFAKTWVSEVDGIAVGFIAMVENEIAGLFLTPEHHGNGLGREMVDFAAKEFGPLKVEVFENNAIGRKFYRSYGFTGNSTYTHGPSGQDVIKLAYQA